MTQIETGRDPLLEELKQVHDMLRRDLDSCRRLASAAISGAPDSTLRDGVAQLQTRSPLFQLRVNCLNYCHLVHAHHGGEDIRLFPAVRRSAPHLDAHDDRLEADHKAISTLLDEVESSANTLAGEDGEAARARLYAALMTLFRISSNISSLKNRPSPRCCEPGLAGPPHEGHRAGRVQRPPGKSGGPQHRSTNPLLSCGATSPAWS